MTFETLKVETREGVGTITINRPDKLNALNAQVVSDLGGAIDQVRQLPEIRAAIITGAGPKAFVAGADISEFLNL